MAEEFMGTVLTLTRGCNFTVKPGNPVPALGAQTFCGIHGCWCEVAARWELYKPDDSLMGPPALPPLTGERKE